MKSLLTITPKNKKVYIISENYRDFLELLEKNAEKILETIEKELGSFLFRNLYVILDDWKVSRAILLHDKAIVLLNTKGGKRKEKELLFYFIHELCHLTAKGNYPLGKTPKEIHEKFDEIARRISEKVLR